MQYFRILILTLLCGARFSGYAQSPDSLTASNNNAPERPLPSPHLYQGFHSFAFPLVLVTYGSIAQSSEELKEMDQQIKTAALKQYTYKTHIDNYLQYAPGLSVFALEAAGIRGRHDLRGKAIIYGLSALLEGGIVQSVKNTTRVQRPDGFGHNAFPSGHTATAFAGAELLREEYGSVSPLYGLAGYTAASLTGFLRICNNRHWFRDVIAGAGVGMLCTRAATLLEPVVEHALFHKKTGKEHSLPAY